MTRIPSLQKPGIERIHKISYINNNFLYSMMDYVWENIASTSLSDATSFPKLFGNLHLSCWTHVKRNSLLKWEWKSTTP
jgi:hypothetical protein